MLLFLFQVHFHQVRYLLQDERHSDPDEERCRCCVGGDHPLFVHPTDAGETGTHPHVLLVGRSLRPSGCVLK